MVWADYWLIDHPELRWTTQPSTMGGQLGAAANFGDRTYSQIWGPNVNNNIYILTHEYSSIGFE